MKIQLKCIGLLFITTFLLKSASFSSEKYRFVCFKDVRKGSLFDEFVQHPTEFEASLGPDVINRRIPCRTFPTKEQLAKRIAFSREISEKFNQSPLALIWSCGHGLPICASLIVSAGLDPNVLVTHIYDYGITPLCLAAYQQNENNEDIVEKLIMLGAKVDFPCETGEMPLHFALSAGYRPTIKLLLAHRADPNARRADGASPIAIAVSKEDPESIALLLKYGADPNLRSFFGIPSICFAAFCEKPLVLETLIKGGARVNEQSIDGRTALHVAAEKGKTENVEMLLLHGADPRIKTLCSPDHLENKVRRGEDPLYLAARAGHTATVRLLLSWKKRDSSI